MALDPREVANTVIDYSIEYKKPLTHLSLQKILYFLHGKYLIKNRNPLILGYFEAWKFGPVHPLIFSCCKKYGREALVEHLSSFDVMTGKVRKIGTVTDIKLKSYITSQSYGLLNLSAGQLVDLSHAENSPWDIVTKQGSSGRIFGDRINNDIILSAFSKHKMSISLTPTVGDPSDEQPPS